MQVGVGMVTIWKNVSNVLTSLGDVIIFRKRYNWSVWATLALMLGSAVVGASTDVRFSWSGYAWQLVNCVATSAYALYLRSTMDRVRSARPTWCRIASIDSHSFTCCTLPLSHWLARPS
jgi:GDP-mannose transporter